MENPNYYSILPANIRYSKEINDGEKILYTEITALSNKYGFCFASNKYFADLYGVSIVTISTRINNLKKAGFINIEMEMQGKQIIRRIIKIADDVLKENLTPIKENLKAPIKENLKTGIKENFKDNNINNNTINNNNIKDKFEIFRKKYKGTKRGSETEFKNFQKHYDYKEVIDELIPALERLEQYRKQLKDEQRFIPEYKNLKTWINNRCWEEEYEIKQQKKPSKENAKQDWYLFYKQRGLTDLSRQDWEKENYR